MIRQAHWGAVSAAGRSGLSAGTAAAALAWMALTAALAAGGAHRVLLLLVLAPLLEEAALRAGLHEALLKRKWQAAACNLTTALVFAVLHVAVQGRWEAALVAGPALVIGAAYNRWGRLRWCVLLHAAMNGLWLAIPLMNVAA